MKEGTLVSLSDDLKPFRHLLSEPLKYSDLDLLHALYCNWVITLGDSPGAIAACNVLDQLIKACIERRNVALAYRELEAWLEGGGSVEWVSPWTGRRLHLNDSERLYDQSVS